MFIDGNAIAGKAKVYRCPKCKDEGLILRTLVKKALIMAKSYSSKKRGAYHSDCPCDGPDKAQEYIELCEKEFTCIKKANG